MKAVTYDRFGPPEVLRLEDVPTPTPADGEVRVRVRVTAVTPTDVAARSATPWFARLAFGPVRPRSRILGSECAGEVDGVGGGVESLAVGDRVVVSSAAFGAHAEQVCVAAAGAVAIPATLGDEDAVAIADGGLTALPFLRDHARLRAGQRLLVNGASGSVGLAAVQLAKVVGAEVTGVCSGRNAELVTKIGADRVIDYTREDPAAAEGAYDVVFDAVGLGSYGRFRRTLRPGGVYLTTVPSLSILGQTLLTRLGRRRAAIAFTGLRPAAAKAEDLRYLLGLAEAGAYTPVIDHRFPLEAAADAHRRVGAGHKVGTVLLTV